jgi:hypothetical protein
MNIGKSYKMDNSYKGLDGTIYRSNKKPDDLYVKDLMDMDVDCALLIWSDFANSHSVDHVVLKDRCI